MPGKRRTPVEFDERIYEASPQTLLAVIKETGPEVRTLLMVGHNPGLQELAALLVATGDIETRQRLQEAFPTSGLAVIEFALDGWDRAASAGRPAGALHHAALDSPSRRTDRHARGSTAGGGVRDDRSAAGCDRTSCRPARRTAA